MTEAGIPEVKAIGKHAFLLRGFALPYVKEALAALEAIQTLAPFRHMVTPGGFTMSVGLTNCGALGWTTDRRGYRYTRADPMTGKPWPAMPPVFMDLASAAAAAAGFPSFEPDACFVNRYVPGARLTLHQDKNEKDFAAPVVSASFGMTATFLFGGLGRADRTTKISLHHGDIVVWGGEDRLRFHGVMALKGDAHSLLGHERINFTFRKAARQEDCNYGTSTEPDHLAAWRDASRHGRTRHGVGARIRESRGSLHARVARALWRHCAA